MSYLLYCIFRGPLPPDFEIPAGVGGQRVVTTNDDGFGAALSKLAESASPLDASRLLAYEAVVESFHRHMTVIPMRYGCRVVCPYDALVLLRENHDGYGELLRELEGLAEMGIQLLLDASGDPVDACAPPVRSIPLPSYGNSGTTYLASKRERYVGQERAGVEQRELVEELCVSLEGSFVRHKVEFPSSRRSRLLSLYFLVPRDSVETFRSAVRRLPTNRSVKLLLSGPWPPYNFVDALQP